MTGDVWPGLCIPCSYFNESEMIEVPAKILASTENMSYEDWLEHRKLGIGGSDASVVCGINRYKSPVELWMEKTNQLPTQEAGEAAYWGTQLEAICQAANTCGGKRRNKKDGETAQTGRRAEAEGNSGKIWE